MRDAVLKLINWIKENKLTGFLVLVVLYLVFYPQQPGPIPLLSKTSLSNAGYSQSVEMMATDQMALGRGGGTSSYYPSPNVAPQPDVTDRKVITNSSMSLQVKDVRDVMEKIKQKTRDLGGYMVETTVNTPEFGENGSIVVRIPSDTLDSTLEYFRSLSVKVVSENISGNDITDQYVDLQARIDRLEATKAKFEQILDQATTVDEILKVQQQILNMQDQIDSYKGRMEYLDGASSTTLIRVYLSTDELSLPYAPSQGWRPGVVFKQAVRSLLSTLIQVGNAAIWLAVYIPLLAAAVLIIVVVKRLYRNYKKPSQN